MASALIKINSVVGSNTDLPINTLVQLDNQNSGGETTYTWSVLDQPPGTADALSATNIQNPTLLPKKEGSYLIKLIVNMGLPSEVTNTVIAGIKQLKSRERVPAAQETTQADGARGWATDVGRFLQHLDNTIADPGVLVGIAGTAGMTQGTIVRATASAVIKSGLPGQETLPSWVPALATAAGNVDELLGVLETGVDGSPSPGNGAIIKVRIFGRYSTSVSGASAVVGEPVFVSDTGGMVRGTPGTNRRVIGSVLSVSGATFEVMFFGGIVEPTSSGVVNGSGTAGQVAFWSGTSTIAGDGLVWDNTNKRLGINNVSPTYLLDILGDTSQNGGRITSPHVNSTDWIITNTSSGGHIHDLASTGSGHGLGAGRFVMYDGTANLTRLVIDPSGNYALGGSAVGGVNPNTRLHLQAVAANDVAVEMEGGSTVGVSPSSRGRLRYNQSTQHFEISENGGAYSQLSTGGSALGFSALVSGQVVFADSTSSVTSDSAHFWDNTNKRLGIGTNAPGYGLDIRSATVNRATLHIRTGATTDTGGWLAALSNDQLSISAGATHDGTNWIAKATTASIVTPDVGGQFTFYNGTGLTIGNSFTPTLRMIIDPSGNVGFGIAAPGQQVHMLASGANSILQTEQYTADGIGPGFIARKARGTSGSPTQALSGDTLGAWRFQGYHSGGAFSTAVAQILAIATQNFTNSAQGTAILFETTPNGSTTRAERMRIDYSGFVGIGTTAPGVLLHVSDTTNYTIASGNPNVFIGTTVTQAADTGGSIGFGGNTVGITTQVPFAYIWGRKENGTSGNEAGYLAFGTRTTGNANERARFTSDGFLGIGATTSLIAAVTLGKADGASHVLCEWRNSSGTTEAWMGVIGTATQYVTTSAVNDVFIRSQTNLLFSTNTAGLERMRLPSDGGLQMSASTSAVSASSTGRLRYNSSTQKFQVSENGAAYVDLSSGGSMSIGGTVTSGTAGSVLFVGTGPVLSQDNATFFWDTSTKRLHLGGNSPQRRLHVTVSDGTIARFARTTATAQEWDINIDSTGTLIIGNNTDTSNRLHLYADGHYLFSGTVANTDAAVEWNPGQTAAVSAASKGRIRYNATAQQFQLSENTGAYVQILTPNSGAVKATSVSDFQLTTTGATSVTTFTPAAAGNYVVFVYYRVTTATTNVTITVTWTDGTGAQTYDVQPLSSQPVNSYAVAPFYINSTAAAITVTATAGTANQVFVSSSITGV